MRYRIAGLGYLAAEAGRGSAPLLGRPESARPEANRVLG